MTRYIVVARGGSRYHRIPKAKFKFWEEVLEAIDGEPALIERLTGSRTLISVYLVALKGA